ncbi:hypothetical protein [Streptomyces boluensis]|uniref:Uncharacterized protein n=1 Tax=Streptomyces boluensis TaxID=1775135 RepID=A0A964UM33_9ACTN|nr:hypothetical protein [Streptomyces boluensis]NBE51723.1 hypothetical protein [Streptomyces boluensis]
MITVQTSEGDVTLGDEDRFLLRAVVREIYQASYCFEGDAAWAGFPELFSAVRAERSSADGRVGIGPEQLVRLGKLADVMFEHLGGHEFHTRAGATLQEAQELMHRLTVGL